MANTAMTPPTIQDSRYSWLRLAVSLALSTIGGIGLWAGIVVLALHPGRIRR